MMQWFHSDVEIDTRDVTEIFRIRCGLRNDVHAGDRMSFREQQKKELVTFEAQETESYTQEGKDTGNSRVGKVLQVAAGRGRKRRDGVMLRADISVPLEA